MGLYTVAIISATIGATLSTYAMRYGQAGIVNCFENLKVPWQVIIILIASGGTQIPTLGQLLGMLFGVGGAIVIIRY
jgi:hypothetical protein